MCSVILRSMVRSIWGHISCHLRSTMRSIICSWSARYCMCSVMSRRAARCLSFFCSIVLQLTFDGAKVQCFMVLLLDKNCQ